MVEYMENNNEKEYVTNIVQDEKNMEYSWLVSLIENKIEIDEIKKLLDSVNDFTLLDFEVLDGSDFLRVGSYFEIKAKLQYMPIVYDEEPKIENKDIKDCLCFHIALIPANDILEYSYEVFSMGSITEEEYNNAKDLKYAIHISTKFENFVLMDLQRQIKLLSYISFGLDTKPAMFIDVSSYMVKSATWLRYTAEFEILPSLDYLYSIHAVFDDDTDPDNIEYWFHTHGLCRCNMLELEILSVTRNDDFGNILNNVAKRFLEHGMTKEGETFSISDGVDIAWFKYENAIKKLGLSNSVLGSLDSRDNSSHTKNSAVLLAVNENGEHVSLDYYNDISTYLLSNFETSIMTLAANKTVGLFLSMFKENKNKENIFFLVKLRFEDEQVEHLWFELNDFDNDTFHVTLLNEPFQDFGIHENDKGKYSRDILTNWSIHIEDEVYGPHNAYLLF